MTSVPTSAGRDAATPASEGDDSASIVSRGIGIRLRSSLLWVVPAGVTLAVCLAGIQRPVLWQDELATLSASTRSLYDLVRLSAHRDPVLAPYYALIHVWTELFGASPTSLRLPSALAMAAAAGVTAVLGGRLFDRRAGLLAGLVVAFIPAVSRYGQEARPYAVTFLLASVSTLLLVRAMDRPDAWRWVLYGAGIIGLGSLQITAVVLVGAHGLAVLSQWYRDHDRSLIRWFAASGVALVVLTPLAFVGALSSGTLSRIPMTSWSRVAGLPGELFVAPVVAGVVIGVGLLAAFRRGVAGLLCTAIAVLPVAVFVVVSLEMPLLRSRYLLFTLLGWALLAGAALSRFGRWEACALIAGIVALGLPAQFALRSETKNGQPDYRAIAQVMASGTEAGDAIIVPTDHGVRFRIGLQAYLPASSWPHDVLATSNPVAAAELDDLECRPATCFGSPPRIWVGCMGTCANPLAAIRPETASAIINRGYAPERTWRVKGGAIALYVRRGGAGGGDGPTAGPAPPPT